MSTLAVIEHRSLVGKRNLRSLIVSGIITPAFYVLAMGLGLGSLVDKHSTVLGVPYVDFVAPGLMAAMALQVATFESTYPILGGFKWTRIYYGMAASPLRPVQIALGELGYIALRVLLQSSLFIVVVSVLTRHVRPSEILAIPAAILCALSFSSPVAALAASMEDDSNFSIVLRFAVTPMFLFAGTFYPVSQLPDWGRWVAYVTPLYHGTVLCRDATIGGVSLLADVGHVAYLALWLATGVTLFLWRFKTRIEK